MSTEDVIQHNMYLQQYCRWVLQ